MRKMFVFLISFAIFSCSSPVEDKSIETLSAVEEKPQDIKKEKVNPAIYFGSDFGNYFQVLYRQEKYNLMLKHTSKESIEKHGSEKILSYYEKMQFAHRINLNNMNETSDSTYTMNYVINQMATRKMWRLEVEIENDSVKVVLPDNIKYFLKY